jgi:hypothetical protein
MLLLQTDRFYRNEEFPSQKAFTKDWHLFFFRLQNKQPRSQLGMVKGL